MTSPAIPQLRARPTGNIATEASSGIASLLQGLMQQRQANQQQAMTTALNQANISHLNAETAGLNQDLVSPENQTENKNYLTGKFPAASGVVNTLSPRATRTLAEGSVKDELQGDTNQIVPTAGGGAVGVNKKNLNVTQIPGLEPASTDLRQQGLDLASTRLTDRNLQGIISRYNTADKTPSDALAAYARIKDSLKSGSAMAPYDALGALVQLAVPNNAREASTLLTAMKAGKVLGGPFTAYENILNKVNRIVQTTGNTMTPEAMTEINRAADALIQHHQQVHLLNKSTAINEAKALNLEFDPKMLRDPYEQYFNQPTDTQDLFQKYGLQRKQ